MNNENYIDVEFEDIAGDDGVTYSSGEVAKMINEEDYVIRNWCKHLDDVLKIKRQGNHRRFTKKNIEELRFIANLIRNEGKTIPQVKEYCTKKPQELVEGVVNNPFAMNLILEAIKSDIEINMKELGSELLKQNEEMMFLLKEWMGEENKNIKNRLDSIQEELAISFDKKINHIEDEINKELNRECENRREERKEQTDLLIEVLQRQKSQEEKYQEWLNKREEWYEKPQSFLGKMFSKLVHK